MKQPKLTLTRRYFISPVGNQNLKLMLEAINEAKSFVRHSSYADEFYICEVIKVVKLADEKPSPDEIEVIQVRR